MPKPLPVRLFIVDGLLNNFSDVRAVETSIRNISSELSTPSKTLFQKLSIPFF